MHTALVGLAALAGLAILLPILRLVIAVLFSREVADQAIARLPQEIHLERAAQPAWRDDLKRERVTREIEALGFTDAGVYTVRELPGVNLRLFAHPAEGFLGSLTEHERAGTWVEFWSRYPDGTTHAFSTLKSPGLAPPPTYVCTRMLGATPAALWRRALAERPQAPALPAEVDRAAADFEAAYKASAEWHRNRVVSRREVAKVAMRNAA